MFTVKIVDYEGNENIWQTRNVVTRASERKTSDAPTYTDNVWFQTEEGDEIELSGKGATIYVMNDNGKTVAKYSLGEDRVVLTH